MKPLPHEYSVSASAHPTSNVKLSCGDLEAIDSAPPRDFDGPGDLWSPEELFLAAVVDCFVLTFKAIARASKLPWVGIEARVDGVLARVDHITRFSELTVHAVLTVGPDAVDEAKALRMLEKAEQTCLITNSLAVPVKLETRIEQSSDPAGRS